MRIDSIAAKADGAGRHRVQFSDGTTMRLYRQTVEDLALFAGMELTDEEMAQLREAAGKMSAKMRAVRIVAASNVSRKDLEQRLIRKGEKPEQAREAVAWMEDLDLVDDARTAEQIVSQCVRKGYGLARAKQALYEKRIPKEYWEETLADFPDQQEHILTYLRSKLQGEWNEKDLKRAVDALLRRGHNYTQIRQALRLLDAEELLEDQQWH